MTSYFVWPAAILLGWIVAYFIWIKPLRAKLVAVVPSIVEAVPVEKFVAGEGVVLEPPTAWQKFLARIEGWKTIGLSFALSIFATASAIFNAVMQNSSLLDDFQALPWASVFKPAVALKIVSALLIIVPIFHMWGKVKAAVAVPISTESN
jgi:hypothetical protein